MDIFIVIVSILVLITFILGYRHNTIRKNLPFLEYLIELPIEHPEFLYERLYSYLKGRQQQNRTPLVLRLLSLLIPSAEERESIIGDMTEEYAEFKSKNKARIWLYKQVIKSAFHLTFKSIKRAIASALGIRIR